MCSPPPRDKANQDVIWQGLATGVFDVFSSDHDPIASPSILLNLTLILLHNLFSLGPFN